MQDYNRFLIIAQGELIRQKIRQKDTLKLKDVELLKAYDIQGVPLCGAIT